eukprot:TRINITY_DN775925_c0_g1_i1.p1 TRINITY_DN775925_c0_g1~~TRINITY_DN775925_c0_g1_i1.p1  ORF type:complete len:235 (-),score=62.60 TRINITY_DN775925_c0_g1_i1:92-796(-)
MGKKKSGKGKAKKELRKALLAKTESGKNTKKQACFEPGSDTQHRNVLTSFESALVFDKNGIVVTIEQPVAELPVELIEKGLELTRTNMKEMYNVAAKFPECEDWKWSDEDKIAEFKHEDARFLILRSEDEFVGFAQFRFTFEQNEGEVPFPALYLYEIQLVPSVQKKGIGYHLMELIEGFARELSMERILLTVLKGNEGADKFYREKCKFVVDFTDPSLYDQRRPYTILSKSLV